MLTPLPSLRIVTACWTHPSPNTPAGMRPAQSMTPAESQCSPAWSAASSCALGKLARVHACYESTSLSKTLCGGELLGAPRRHNSTSLVLPLTLPSHDPLVVPTLVTGSCLASRTA